MKPTPFRDRHGLYAVVYLAWGITLLAFVVSGAYRNFIQPSLAPLLWLAVAILLLFAAAETVQLGRSTAAARDVVRCGLLILPLFALWLAVGQPLNSQAYLKRAVTPRARPEVPGDGANPGKIVPSGPNSQSQPRQASILELLQNPKAFEGQWVETEGMALGRETMRKDPAMRKEALVPGAFVLFRFGIVCCVADSQPLGLLVEGADPKTVADNDWYRVTGRFTIDRNQMGTLSNARVNRIKEPESPYLYGNPNPFQGGAQTR